MRLPAGVASPHAAAPLPHPVPSSPPAAQARRVLVIMVAAALTGSAALLPSAAAAAPSAPDRAAPRHAAAATARPPRVGQLYAIDHRTHRVVRFDLVGGRWQLRPVGRQWSDPSALAVSPSGVAWVVDDGALVRVSGNGRTLRVARVRDTDDVHLAADRFGRVFWNDGNTVHRASASGRTVTRMGAVRPAQQPIVGLGVDGRGRPMVAYLGPLTEVGGFSAVLVLAEFGTRPGAPRLRPVLALGDLGGVGDYGLSRFHEAPNGAVIVSEFGSPGTGLRYLDVFAPGATIPTGGGSGRVAETTGAFDSRSRLFVAEDTRFCYAADDSGCQPDTRVDHLLVYPAKGGTWFREVPTSNLRQPTEIAAGVDSRVFAVDGSRLKTVAPQGGPAVTVATGWFSALRVPAGR